MDVGFGDLVFRDLLPVPGVLLLRLHGLGWEEKAEISSRVVTLVADRLPGNFVVASRDTVRVRPLPRI